MNATEIDHVLDRLIKREGGYVNDPNDRGGETKYGISKRSYPDVDIKNLTIPKAKAIYIRDFIFPNQLHKLENEDVFESILDWMVHSGASVVKAQDRVKRLQGLLGLEIDGIVGPDTIEAINRKGKELERLILMDRLFFLLRLTKHPYIVGWVRRLVELGL